MFFSTLLATVSHRVAGDGDDTKTIAPDFLARLGSDLLATAIKVRFEKFFFGLLANDGSQTWAGISGCILYRDESGENR